jgi:hypothetical protein
MDVETVSLVLLVLFVVGLGLALFRLSVRGYKYWAGGDGVPSLVHRDMILLMGLSFPFTAILLARFLALFTDFDLEIAHLVNSMAWNLVTGIPAVIAVWVFVYYEYFKVEDKY